MYTWSYLIDASLAKLDLTQDEATQQNLLGRFYIYANEVITQVCSAVKPKHTFVTFVVNKDDVGTKLFTMPDDFISFGDDINTKVVLDKNLYNPETQTFGREVMSEATDFDFQYKGYNQLVFYKEGTYTISYNARWFDFYTSYIDDDTYLTNVPDDIADCLPSYIASQCYKPNDEIKATLYRNEYEVLLSRIDATDYSQTKVFTIGGNW